MAHSIIDRSRIGTSNNAFPNSLQYSLRSHQLIDSWRAHNVGSRGYTFYSHPHDSYFHLHYIFCSPILVVNSTTVNIHVCLWSDHHIVSCNLSYIGLPNSIRALHLNDSLLTDPAIYPYKPNICTPY